MYPSIWKAFNNSVCTLNYFNKRNILYYRSTGFRLGNFLICGCCIREIKNGDYLTIEFISTSPVGHKSILKFTAEDLYERSAGNQRELSGINFLSIRQKELEKVPPIRGFCQSEPAIGTPVAILACSTRTDHPYLKSGMVSSNLDVNGRKMILIESTIEKGNCGAPVINAESGRLIGVLTDEMTSSSDSYRSLKPIIDENINRLKRASGKWTIGDIDPAQVLAANQYMIKHLAREFCLSAHCCSGLLIPASRMIRYIESLDHNELFEFTPHS
jgi:hypothetical protein